jgi:hypothetical protein
MFHRFYILAFWHNLDLPYTLLAHPQGIIVPSLLPLLPRHFGIMLTPRCPVVDVVVLFFCKILN